MANTITIDILADTRKLVQGVNTANQQLSGLQQSISKAGRVAASATAIATAGRGLSRILNVFKEATKSAIAFNDSMDAVRMTLKDPASYSAFTKFIDSAPTKLGLSTEKAAEFATSVTAIGASMGLKGKELLEFTKNATKVAVDLRSRKGGKTTIDETMTATLAALTGEYTSMKRFGVNINDTAIKAYNLEKRLVKVNKNGLTPQQKSLIAMTMLLDTKVNAAVGNFEATIGEAGNQLEILNAQTETAKTKLGQAFIPALLSVVKTINDKLIKAFKDAPTAVQGFIVAFLGLSVIAAPVLIAAAALGALDISLKALIIDFAVLAAPVLAVIAAIAALVAVGVLLWQNWDTVKRVAGELWEGIKKAFTPIANFIKDVFTAAWEGIKPWLQLMGGIAAVLIGIFLNPVIALFNTVKNAITKALGSEAFDKFIAIVKKVIGYVSKQWGDFAKTFISIGVSIVKGIWSGISSAGTWLRDKFFKFFGDLIPGWVKKMLGIKSPSKVFIEFGQQIVKGLAIGMNPSGVRTASSGLAMGAMSGFGPAQLAGTGGMSGGIVVNINAGLGTDPYELGRVVSQALNKYESINGTR